MKPSIIASAILLTLATTSVMAACPATGLTGSAIVSLVSGKYACATDPNGSDTWNELHQGAGLGPSNIEDYKKGPNDPVDPSKVVGTYAISNGANPDTITYNYGDPGGPYQYVVNQTFNPNPGAPVTYMFCDVRSSKTFVVIISPSHC
jgi:hypothetical protein